MGWGEVGDISPRFVCVMRPRSFLRVKVKSVGEERASCGVNQKSVVPLTYYAKRYIIRVMISSFKDKDTRELFGN